MPALATRSPRRPGDGNDSNACHLSAFAVTRIDPAIYIALFFTSVLLVAKYIDRMPYYDFANELLQLRLPRSAFPGAHSAQRSCVE